MGQRIGGSKNGRLRQGGSVASARGEGLPLIVQPLAESRSRAVGEFRPRAGMSPSLAQGSRPGMSGLPSRASNPFPRFPLMAGLQPRGPIPGDLQPLRRLEAQGFDAMHKRPAETAKSDHAVSIDQGKKGPDRSCGVAPCEATVKLNVIYDRRAHGGKGLSQQEKENFAKNILRTAQKEYANAFIDFDISYSPGELFEDEASNLNMAGLQRQGINVVVTDMLPSKLRDSSPGKGASFISKGYAVSAIGLREADDSTLAHELSHHFLGDTTKPPSNIFSQFIGKTVGDISNDFTRWQLRTFGVHRYNKATGGLQSINPFIEGARRFGESQ